MNRPEDKGGEVQAQSYVKQEAVSYGYDVSSYVNYSNTTATPTSLNQPLPGQPPLPPMPPPQGAVPPPPSVFSAMPAQMTQIHTWPHAPAAWQWITPQASPMPSQAPRDLAAAAAFQKDMPMRNNYVKRDRYNHNRNNVYQQRGNFHRKNNRRMQRFDQAQGQFDQASYYNAALTNGLGLDWQRGNETIMGQALMQLPMQAQLSHMGNVANANKKREPATDQDIKEEVVVVKKNKQRKPMSQSYPSRPWNREDAERALKTEKEYNKTVKAQSLIIKFPDPDLNKDVVKKFHAGIQNIHFQSPSGPRYCFVQMSENVNIDEAIKELEKIQFGVGTLKVERKSLRDEDNPIPEEIDPYTLYIGNLPNSVIVNEVENKFPTAARVDVGYAQKMRNTRYAFIRYNSVDESIAAYRQAHDLMWDTRSIIVRFRRQRGNCCLPGEPKSNPKKKEEADEPSAPNNMKTDEKSSDDVKEKDQITSENQTESKTIEDKELSSNITEASKSTTNSLPLKKRTQIQQDQTMDPQSSHTNDTPTCGENSQDDANFITEIKEEPIDYDEMNEISMEEDDEDDDGEIYPDGDDFCNYDEDSNNEDNLSITKTAACESPGVTTSDEDGPSDTLDKMFSDLESAAGNICM